MSTNKQNNQKKHIAFLHPDLGIGGAERLVVDCAVALQGTPTIQQTGSVATSSNNEASNIQHSVTIFTSHCSPSHSFSETQDGTLDVKVFGDWLPSSVFGALKVVCAWLRVLYVTICLLYYHFAIQRFNVAFVDQVSFTVPLLRLFGLPVLFYCHFPDKLLTERKSTIKKLYRLPIDVVEELTTATSTRILVNSEFTKGIVRKAFTLSCMKNKELHVVYPAVNFDSFDEHLAKQLPLPAALPPNSVYFVSLNRYERKKNISLAIQSFATLKQKLDDATFESVHLIIAGGYDPLVTENLQYKQELEQIAKVNSLTNKVHFLTSISDEEKVSLLSNSVACLYTPSNEHFGIVPVETMYTSTPVIAVNNGGPKESIVHEETGYLCNSSEIEWANAMANLLLDTQLRKEMGRKAKERAMKNFSHNTLRLQLNRHISTM